MMPSLVWVRLGLNGPLGQYVTSSVRGWYHNYVDFNGTLKRVITAQGDPMWWPCPIPSLEHNWWPYEWASSIGINIINQWERSRGWTFSWTCDISVFQICVTICFYFQNVMLDISFKRSYQRATRTNISKLIMIRHCDKYCHGKLFEFM